MPIYLPLVINKESNSGILKLLCAYKSPNVCSCNEILLSISNKLTTDITWMHLKKNPLREKLDSKEYTLRIFIVVKLIIVNKPDNYQIVLWLWSFFTLVILCLLFHNIWYNLWFYVNLLTCMLVTCLLPDYKIQKSKSYMYTVSRSILNGLHSVQ
jgi:hypothetical protein